jgi:endonuclease/exonuclease/phosphatase family metal-dependent hydrolase
MVSLIGYYNADFIGTQEGLKHQLDFIIEKLPFYTYAGVARNDGKESGEYSAILYNKERFKLIEQNTFWLSPTPNLPSKGWDTAFERICSYGLFYNKSSKKYLWVLNTHFDHVGKEARLNAAKIIVEKIKELKKKKNCGLVFMGDLNVLPEDDSISIIKQQLNDAFISSETPAYGPKGTWNAFQFGVKPERRIDYIFIDKDPSIKVTRFATIDDFYDFKYPSDHLPVLAHIEIK